MKKAISLLLSLMLLISTFTGLSITAGAETTESDITPINLNSVNDVVIDEEDECVLFSFTPDKDGVYTLYSNSVRDTVCTLYNANNDYIVEDDDTGKDLNFRLSYYMTAGTTYVYEVGFLGNDVGNFQVMLEESSVQSIEVLSDIVVYEGNGYWESYYDEDKDDYLDYFNYYYSLEDVNIKINFKDGSEVTTTVGEGYDDIPITNSDSQKTNHWTADGENLITFTYDGVSTTASALIQESPFESIEPVANDVTLVENYDGEWQEHNHLETGELHEYFCYTVDSDAFSILVNYKDGSSTEVGLGDAINGVNVIWDANQDSVHWTVGSENYITVSFMDLTTQIPVTIIENPVLSLEVVSDPLTFLENTGGYWEFEEDSDEKFFYYNADVNYIDIKVNFSDGTSKVYNYNEDVLGYSFHYRNNQYSKHWTVGEDNYLTIALADITTTAPVIIKENPVDSIEYVSGEVLAYDDCGYLDDRYDSDLDDYVEFFRYSFDSENVKIKVNYKDGTSAVAFVNSDLNGYEILCEDNQEEEPWSKDKTNYITVSYLGATVKIPVTIKTQEPIKITTGKYTANIDVGRKTVTFVVTPEKDGKYVFYADSEKDTYGYLYDADGNLLKEDDDTGEGTNFYISYEMKANETYIFKARYYSSSRTGSFDVYFDFDPIKSLEVVSDPVVCYIGYGVEDEREDEEGNMVPYFYYYYSTSTVKIKINYIDGASVIIDNLSSEYNGFEFYWEDNQYNKPWTVDGDNYITFLYAGSSVNAPVLIKENNVVSIEYVSGAVTCYKGYGYYNEENDSFYYNYNPTNANIKINYNDGTYLIVDIDDTVNGFGINCKDKQYENPWTVGGENYVYVEYLNATTTVPVEIVDNPVKNIEVVSSDLVFTENEGGDYDTDNDGNEYYYYDTYLKWEQIEDTVVKVNYKDGTSKTCKIKDELDGYDFEWYSEQYTNHWTLGSDNYIYVKYLGVTGKIPVTIVGADEPKDEPDTPAKSTTITLAKSSATLYLTGTTSVKATVTNGVGATTYKSSNTKVATVNANGKITAKKAGTATITVTNNGVSKTFKITVKKPTLNAKNKTLTVGKKFKLKITGKIGKATFVSTKPKVAKVNKNGKIVAKKNGTATIKVKTNGITLKCKVKVK